MDSRDKPAHFVPGAAMTPPGVIINVGWYYGLSLPSNWTKLAGYVNRILRGADPASEPIQQPTLFDFVLNLKTAKALGLTIPDIINVRVTAVIE